MSRMLIAGNWKMNLTREEALSLTGKLVSTLSEQRAVDIVLCPPFCYIPLVFQGIKGSTIRLGAQNCHPEPNGAFTGEVSAAVLESMEVQFCIVGHSERRQNFSEDDAFIARKIDALLEAGIWPILCVGETLEERKADKTWSVVSGQLKSCLEHVSAEEVSRIAVAYEPVWAIGTGENATPQQAEEIHSKIREYLEETYGTGFAEATRIIYGGSVDGENAPELLNQPNIDGALVGGASLDEEEFEKIVKAAAEA